MLRPRRGEPTPVDRTEAFSDGVFGVAITLLALDLARIHADPDRRRAHPRWRAHLGDQPDALAALIEGFLN